MDVLQEQFINLLGTVLTLLAAYVAKQVKDYLDRKGVLAELENKRKYADIAVKAAKDMYVEADGSKKLKEAKKQLVQMLNDKGITFTEDELDSLIRSAYQGMLQGLSK